MQDRVALLPNRYLVTPEDGSETYYVVLTRADQATADGTLLNKENLLSDATATALGLTPADELTVDDAFAEIATSKADSIHASQHAAGGTDAISPTSILALGYGSAQTLTSGQKQQISENAGVLPSALADINLLINGGFDVWQEGINFNVTGYTAEMWKMALGTGMAITATRQAFAIGQTDVPSEPQYYLQLAITNAGSADGSLEQRIEFVRTGAGGKISYAFWAKCDASTYTAKVQLVQNFGSGGSADVETTAQDVTLTTLWQLFTGTFDVASISGKTIGSGDYLSFKIVLPTASGTKTVSLANVNACHGPTSFASPRRRYAEELRMCQRYCWIGTSPYGTQAYKYSTASTHAEGVVFSFPVTMRSTPAVTILTAPIYDGCAHMDVGADVNGICHRVSVASSTIYRVRNGVYKADARL